MIRVVRLALSTCVSLVLLVLQACSGVQVSQDYNQNYAFSRLKTFAWKPNENNEYGLSDNALVDKRIRDSMVNGFLGKKYSLIESSAPDFYISYHITVEQKITTSNVNGGVVFDGYGGGHYSSIGISTGSQVYTYDQGTLLIDVTDVTSNALVWRGVSTQIVSKHSSPEESTQKINETVGKMLELFPPH